MENPSYLAVWADCLTATDFEGYPTLETARAVALENAQSEGLAVAIWSEASQSVVEIVTSSSAI